MSEEIKVVLCETKHAMAKQPTEAVTMVVGKAIFDPVAFDANSWHAINMIVPFMESRFS
ncbi:hypothetical protein [Planctopirus hydrillae]|uniref:hypothetical protein n=1 Tax=Planctopirus hydrillae TaxID=1841610 RepID=UPI0013F4F8FF|nr:hypothetical protein [Planctopirus hydrillae]